MTLDYKIDVHDKLGCDESVTSVGRHFHISETCVRTTLNEVRQLLRLLMKRVHCRVRKSLKEPVIHV
jgi:hypothetical protein